MGCWMVCIDHPLSSNVLVCSSYIEAMGRWGNPNGLPQWGKPTMVLESGISTFSTCILRVQYLALKISSWC